MFNVTHHDMYPGAAVLCQFSGVYSFGTMVRYHVALSLSLTIIFETCLGQALSLYTPSASNSELEQQHRPD